LWSAILLCKGHDEKTQISKEKIIERYARYTHFCFRVKKTAAANLMHIVLLFVRRDGSLKGQESCIKINRLLVFRLIKHDMIPNHIGYIF
jgi:hypothetical protein